MIKALRKNKKGFSLLDVMMALGVVTLGLMGIISLATQNIQEQSTNKNYLTASMLAQEGLELARNVRDTNFLNGGVWDNGLVGEDVTATSTFTIDPNFPISINNIPNLISDALCIIYFNSTSNRYTHDSSGAQATIFRRLVTVVDHANYIEVIATVEWTERGQTHSYEAATNLYDWW
jgi:hypothetical protein